MEDGKIIQLFLARKEEAIRESEQKYGGYCKTIAYNILRNAEDTEECVSDTWWKAWNAIPPTIPDILKTYFGKITRNSALNCYEKYNAEKRGGSELTIALEELGESIAVHEGDISCESLAALTDILNDFLGSLDREKRILFVKRYWHMKSIREIADETGMGESKIKMSLMRTRAANVTTVQRSELKHWKHSRKS